jgi:hypothetical protein
MQAFPELSSKIILTTEIMPVNFGWFRRFCRFFDDGQSDGSTLQGLLQEIKIDN